MPSFSEGQLGAACEVCSLEEAEQSSLYTLGLGPGHMDLREPPSAPSQPGVVGHDHRLSRLICVYSAPRSAPTQPCEVRLTDT